MKTGLAAALLTIAVVTISGHTADSEANVKAAANIAASAPQLYSKHCASCHGRDGRARTAKAKLNHARDLTDSAWQGNVSDERIFNSIMNGKGKKMPGYAKKMSEQEIDSLVAYVRGLKR